MYLLLVCMEFLINAHSAVVKLSTLCFHVFLLSRYEVNFQDTLTCGGGYVKLLSTSEELSQVIP